MRSDRVLLVLDYKIAGFSGLMTALCVYRACVIVHCRHSDRSVLNKAKGSEMIASMIIGFLATGMYQLIFMVGYGTVIPAAQSGDRVIHEASASGERLILRRFRTSLTDGG